MIYETMFCTLYGDKCGSDGKESACNAGDLGLISGSGRCPQESNGNPLQHSFFFFIYFY